MAAYLKKQCYDLSLALRPGAVLRRILDGFVVRVIRDGDTCIADVIDTPALYVVSHADYPVNGRRPPSCFLWRDRAALAPSDRIESEPIAASVDNTRLLDMPGFTYVGVPEEGDQPIASGSGLMSRASVTGTRAVLGVLRTTDLTGVGSGRFTWAGNLDLTIASWTAPHSALVDYPRGVDATRAKSVQRVVITDSGLQSALGTPNVRLSCEGSGLAIGRYGYPGAGEAAFFEVPATEVEPVARGVIVTVPVTYLLDEGAGLGGAQFGISAMRVDLAEPGEDGMPVAATPAWVESILSPEPDQYFSDIALSGDAATLTSVACLFTWVRDEDEGSLGIIGFTYQVLVTRFTADGKVGQAAVYTDSVTSITPATYLWQSIGELSGAVAVAGIEVARRDGVQFPEEPTGATKLMLCRGEDVRVADLPGWAAFRPVSRGVMAYQGEPQSLRRASAIADLGEGEIALLAGSSAQVGAMGAGTIAWHLLVLDAETLAINEDRGQVTSMYFDPALMAYAGQSLSICTVRQQVKNDAGEVTRPAVLLVNAFEREGDSRLLLSADGGMTWGIIRTGLPGGDVIYLGNQLHPVEIGVSL